MKLWNNILLISCLFAVFASCSRDDTTNGTGAISEITIDESSLKAVYDIDKNETLTITPNVTQSMSGKPLAYTWEIEEKAYSHEPQLVYVGNELGKFRCRLVVENEDGKSFYPFTLNVNSPYEEGVTVISRDANGKSMLSFMLKQRVEGVADHFDEGDCFVLNNPDYTFADNVTDVLQCNSSLLLLCKGKGTAENPPVIYYLNAKTFVVENEIRVPEFASGFHPYRALMPTNTTAGTLYPILCEDGKIYEFSSTEGAVAMTARYKSTYSLCGAVYDSGSMSYNDVYLWDNGLQGLTMLYNNYGPYLCSDNKGEQEYLVDVNKLPLEKLKEKNYFGEGGELQSMFIPRAVGGRSIYGERMMVVVKKGNKYQKYDLLNAFYTYDDNTGKVVFDSKYMIAGIGNNGGLTPNSPHVATTLYGYLLYGVGNKVMRWLYAQTQHLKDAKELATVGSPEAVITSMELSEDHTETYVAFYEPGEEGLNGHVWVIKTEDGTLLRKYDNVCYRPEKIIYKKK